MESEQGQDEHAEGPSVIQERLNWKLAWRDDAQVAQGLYAGEAIEEMHELSDAGVLDEFFVFLEEVGMLRAFEQLSLPGVKRVLVPSVQFVLLYFLKVLFGSESMNELPRILFSDLALMELVGFNAQQCEQGLTKRGYDWRSVIENGIFKEGKHPWHLLRFPQRTEAAVVVHSHFTLLVMGLCTAFRLWQAQVAITATSSTEVLPSLSSALLGGEGTARWRQRLREANRDKIIVFIGQAYGIFHLAEFAILTHLPLRRLPSPLGSPQAILQRFGLSP